MEFKIKKVQADYTGGGIYTFSGKCEQRFGNSVEERFFETDTDHYCVFMYDEEPDGTMEDKWYFDHCMDSYLDDTEEAREFFAAMCNWILENHPEGNYNDHDIRNIKAKFTEGEMK